MIETFEPIPEWSNYEVSNLGRVRNIKFNRVLRPSLKRCGGGIKYPFVWLSQDGRRLQIAVHQLVLQVFVGPRPIGYHCRHKDGDPTNVCLSNLVYGTPSDNKEDSIEHQTWAHGESHGNHKLTERTVRIARGLRKCDFTLKRIAEILSVSTTCIHEVLSGKTWKHV